MRRLAFESTYRLKVEAWLCLRQKLSCDDDLINANALIEGSAPQMF